MVPNSLSYELNGEREVMLIVPRRDSSLRRIRRYLEASTALMSCIHSSRIILVNIG